MRYVDHVERNGTGLFELICQRDLEGVVAKLRHGNYVSEREKALGTRPATRTTPRKLDGKICSSGIGEVNQLLAGIRVRSLVQRWRRYERSCRLWYRNGSGHGRLSMRSNGFGSLLRLRNYAL
jgi:hypothetical protein